MKRWGIESSSFDPRLFVMKKPRSFIILGLVVDDLIFTSNSAQMISDFKNFLSDTFDVKMYGELRNFVGWTVEQSIDGAWIHQQPYAETLLLRFGMEHCKPVQTPLSVDAYLNPAHEHEALLHREQHRQYRQIVGALMNLAVSTRPDLSFPAGALARQMHAPTIRHLQQVNRVLRYQARSLLSAHQPPRESIHGHGRCRGRRLGRGLSQSSLNDWLHHRHPRVARDVEKSEADHCNFVER